MRISRAAIPLLPSDQLDQLRAQAVVRVRAAADSTEREKWSRLLLACDQELGRRSKGGGGQSKHGEKARLPERVLSARNALYRDDEKREVKRRADQVRAEWGR